MLGQRLRRWPNIEKTLGQRLVFAGDMKTMPQEQGISLPITILLLCHAKP